MNAIIISIMKKHYNVEMDYDDQNIKVLHRWGRAFSDAVLTESPVEDLLDDVEKAAFKQVVAFIQNPPTGNVYIYIPNSPHVKLAALSDGSVYLHKRTVVTAANRVYVKRGGATEQIIIVGARHFDDVMSNQLDIIESTLKDRGQLPLKHDQGFIDQWGEFIDRKTACTIVRLNQQPLLGLQPFLDSTDELYSEHLH